MTPSVPEYSQPLLIVKLSGNISVKNTDLISIPFDVITYDPLGLWGVHVGMSGYVNHNYSEKIFTAPTDGTYLAILNVGIGPTTAINPYVTLDFWATGGQMYMQVRGSQVVNTTHSFSTIHRLQKDDVITPLFTHSDTANLTVGLGPEYTQFQVIRLGPPPKVWDLSAYRYIKPLTKR